MGSAIGDYIHFHSQRYGAFGTNRADGVSIATQKNFTKGYNQGKKTMETFIKQKKDFFSKRKNNIIIGGKNSSDKEFLTILKELMNSWNLNEKQVAEKGYTEGVYEGVQAVKKILEEDFGNVAEKTIKMVEGTFDTKVKNHLTAKQKVKIKGVKELDIDSQHYVSTIRDTLDNLLIAAQMSFQSEDGISQGKLNDIKNKVTKLKYQLKDFSQKAYNLRKGIYNAEGVKYSGGFKEELYSNLAGYRKGAKLAVTKDTTNFYEEINKLIGQVKATQGIQSMYAGEAFQLAISMAALIAQGKGQEELEKAIAEMLKNKKTMRQAVDKVWTGGVRTNITIKDVSFAQFMDVKSLFSSNQEVQQNRIGNWDITTSFSQDKVDVVAGLDDKRPRLISAKNYHLPKNRNTQIHLVSESPLLTLLIAKTNPNFINHFLNITAINYSKDAGNSTVTEAKELAQEAVKLLLLQTSLKGYKTTQANTFLVNDAITGNIKMLSMNDIITTVINDIDSYFWLRGGSFNFENKWHGDRAASQEDANARISDLIQQLYNYKVSAGINSSAIDATQGLTA